MKIRNSKLRFFGSVGLIIVIILLTRGLFNSEEKINKNNREICIKYKKESFAGMVVDTHKSENRGTFIFVLNNNEGKKYFNYCLVYPEAHIEKGDSIYKLPNSFEYHIYKGGDPSRKEIIGCDDNYCDKWK